MSLSFFRKPSVHFWALGLLLFCLDRWYWQADEVRTVQYPDAEQISLLRNQWVMSTGRQPSDADLQSMVQYELDQSILLAEAIRLDLHRYDSVVKQRLLRDIRFMGDSEGLNEEDMLEQAYAMDLHINDTVAKRRLMQAMDSIYRAPGEARQPTQDELQAIYDKKLEEFTLPPTRQISHVFVSGDRHREEAEQRARSLYDSFSRDQVGLESARQSTDPFLSGLDFSQLSARQLARHFGDTFAGQVFECEGLGWCGPLQSPYGWHLVFVHAEQAAREQGFDAVEQKLRYYYKREQGDKALADKMTELRGIYTVEGGPTSLPDAQEAAP